MNPLSDTFDYFVDDLLSSDDDLLKGELDFLVMQDLFDSIDLKLINKTEIDDAIDLKKRIDETISVAEKFSNFIK